MPDGHVNGVSIVRDVAEKMYRPRSNPAEHDQFVLIPVRNKRDLDLYVRVSPEDQEWVARHTWRVDFERNGELNYPYTRVMTGVNGSRKAKKKYLHRVVKLGWGDAPSSIHVDHENGDHFDCRRRNLLPVLIVVNMRKRRHIGTGASRYCGVNLWRSKRSPKGTWRAECRKEHLGYFATELEAAKAYDRKVVEVYGPYIELLVLNKLLNFPLKRKPRGMADVHVKARTRTRLGAPYRNGYAAAEDEIPF